MKRPAYIHCLRVMILTLCVSMSLTSCSIPRYVERLYRDRCNNRAHLQMVLEDYISSKYHSRKPIRMAVIPFSVPANLAPQSDELPGLGNKLAWSIHSNFLEAQQTTIVEVFNRQDWPGKKEEFFTGNHGAIALAQHAGYDLVMVGYLEAVTSLDSMRAHTKVIDVSNGVTVYYGTSQVESDRVDLQEMSSWWWFSPRRPDLLKREPLLEDLAECVTHGVLHKEVDEEPWT